MNPKGLPALQTSTDPSKPLAQTSCPPVSLSCLAPALEFHNPDGLAGKGNLGLVDSFALESSNIVGGVDFVRAVGHANCPGVSGFKARETRSGGGRVVGGKGYISCGSDHKSTGRHPFLHLLLIHQDFPEEPALPLSWGVYSLELSGPSSRLEPCGPRQNQPHLTGKLHGRSTVERALGRTLIWG